jgi:hypothetical protein
MIVWNITKVKWSKDRLTNEDVIKSVDWIVKKDDNNSTQSGVMELIVKFNPDTQLVVDEEMMLGWVFEALRSEKQNIEDSLQ